MFLKYLKNLSFCVFYKLFVIFLCLFYFSGSAGRYQDVSVIGVGGTRIVLDFAVTRTHDTPTTPQLPRGPYRYES